MNQGNDHPVYFSHPTPYPYPRYGTDGNTNPYPSPSGQLRFDHRSLNRRSYGYREGNPSPSLETRELGSDNRSSNRRGYAEGTRLPSLGNRPSGVDHRLSLSEHVRLQHAPSEYRPLEERLAMRPSSQTSIPTNPPPVSRMPPQVPVIGRNINNVTSPAFLFPRRLTPRLSFNQAMMNPRTQSESTDNESKLSKEEQEQVLKQLRKEIYDPPTTKMTPRTRVSLYYRDLNRDPNYAKEAQHNSKKDEEGKRCAVCLEDFEARDEVMVTPCKHLFHEECIVPWVKNTAQCPVCRSVFCEKIKEIGSRNGNRAVSLPAGHGLSEEDLFSLMQAVDEAFPWGA